MLATRSAFAASTLHIFVGTFGDKAGAMMLRDEMAKLLAKQPGVTLVMDATQADFILSGSGETYIRGYIGTNPRVRYLNSDAQPVYGGFLSVELKPPRQDIIWSYLVTPRRLGPRDISANLAGQIIPKLVEVLRQQKKP